MKAKETDVLGLRVLIADDDPDLADTVRATLAAKLKMSRVAVATNGGMARWELERALERHDPYGLIICDLSMPKYSGMEILKWVRGTPEIAETPFILLTATSDREVVLEAIQAKVTDYLTKPLSEKVLVGKVAKILMMMAS